jgi:hypothetical protein
VADASAEAVRKDLDKGQPKKLRDALREPLSETILPPRMAARNAGDRVGCRFAAKPPDERCSKAR